MRLRNETIQYYVEGENERALLETLKTDMRVIKSGKIQIFNPLQSKFSDALLRTLKPDTIVVLVFDTDIPKNSIFEGNLEKLRKSKFIKRVILIPQVKTSKTNF